MRSRTTAALRLARSRPTSTPMLRMDPRNPGNASQTASNGDLRAISAPGIDSLRYSHLSKLKRSLRAPQRTAASTALQRRTSDFRSCCIDELNPQPIAELQVARFAPAKLPCNGVKPDFGRESAASAPGPPSAERTPRRNHQLRGAVMPGRLQVQYDLHGRVALHPFVGPRRGG